MLNIFLVFRQLSRSFLMFVCPLSEKFPSSLAFMLKTYSSQDRRGIRILSIKRLVNEGVRDKLWAENPHVKPFHYFSAFLGLNLLLLLISAGT